MAAGRESDPWSIKELVVLVLTIVSSAVGVVFYISHWQGVVESDQRSIADRLAEVRTLIVQNVLPKLADHGEAIAGHEARLQLEDRRMDRIEAARLP